MIQERSKVLLYSNYLNTFAYSLFGPLYALFVVQSGGSAFYAGTTWGLYMLVAGILMFYFSRMEDRVEANKKKMIIAGYFILAFGALAFILVKNPLDIYFVQALNALGAGMLGPAWKAMYAEGEDKGREAEGWALFDGGDNILIALAASLGGIFITYFSFQALFVVIFFIQIVAALISTRILKNR